jgi:sporulation protein YlmC with PRC-barrel domain
MERRVIGAGMVGALLLATAAYAQTGAGQAPAMPNKGSQQGTLDMTRTNETTPSEYAVLPLARGQKTEVKNSELLGDEVKSKDGKPIGRLEKLIMDTKTGKIEYGVVTFTDTKEMWPILWRDFKVNRDTGDVTLNLTRDDLKKRTSLDDAKDLSPDIKSLVNDMRKNMGPPVVNPEGLGVTDRPAAGGGQGEDTAAGSGPGGPRALPPQKDAPQFEKDGQKGH